VLNKATLGGIESEKKERRKRQAYLTSYIVHGPHLSFDGWFNLMAPDGSEQQASRPRYHAPQVSCDRNRARGRVR
jgi:hypothetical protein